MALAKRILIEIEDNPMSKIPRVIFAHELPIAYEIWGESAVKVLDPDVAIVPDLPQLISGYDGPIPRKVNPNDKEAVRKVQVEMQRGLGLVEPVNLSARDEYERLQQAWGMHKEVKMSLVEYCYGPFSSGRFSQALRASYEEMSDDDLLAHLTKLGIKADKSSTRKQRIEALETAH